MNYRSKFYTFSSDKFAQRFEYQYILNAPIHYMTVDEYSRYTLNGSPIMFFTYDNLLEYFNSNKSFILDQHHFFDKIYEISFREDPNINIKILGKTNCTIGNNCWFWTASYAYVNNVSDFWNTENSVCADILAKKPEYVSIVKNGI